MDSYDRKEPVSILDGCSKAKLPKAVAPLQKWGRAHTLGWEISVGRKASEDQSPTEKQA